MNSLQILMPMGGLGSRFAEKGYTTPKPLIPIDGKPMFMRALDSFSSVTNPKYIFVIRKEHDEKYDLGSKIKEILPDAVIKILSHDTRGAVETCLVARDVIEDGVPLVVADCDIYFESKEYFDKVSRASETGSPKGLLLTFPANDPRYSYVEIDDSGKAIRTAEKVVISENAILGGYFFSSGLLFKDLAESFVSNELPEGLKEYFMSHLFNLLLDRKEAVEIASIDKMFIFGTPDELEAYLNRSTT